MLRNHLFLSPSGMEQGLGSLAGTAWVLSVPLGTASDLEVLRTWQDQASRSNPDGTSEQYQPTCAHLHSFTWAGWCQQAQLALPACRP